MNNQNPLKCQLQQKTNQLKVKRLQIISINANSIISNQIQIQYANPSTFHIVLISETKLNKRHKVYFKNYSSCPRWRNCNPHKKNPLMFKTMQNDKITSFKILETIIKIKISNKENLFSTAERI